MKALRSWVEDSPFGASLGVGLVESSDDVVTLELPFRAHNANPGDALHGGCAASLGVIGGRVLAARLLENGHLAHTAACQVTYLAAAIGESVTARTELDRQGRSVVFANTTVRTDDGRTIARISSLVRVRPPGVGPPELTAAQGDDGETDPGPMGPFIGSLPFAAERGLDVELMAAGRSRIVMPIGTGNAEGVDDADAGVHEGAVLALIDTTGAMAAWADTGPGQYKASTAGLQAQITAAVPATTLVGYGRVAERDAGFFWCDVEVADLATGMRFARGTVIYRIVT